MLSEKLNTIAAESQRTADVHARQIEGDREIIGYAGLLSIAFQGLLRAKQIILSAIDGTINGGNH